MAVTVTPQVISALLGQWLMVVATGLVLLRALRCLVLAAGRVVAALARRLTRTDEERRRPFIRRDLYRVVGWAGLCWVLPWAISDSVPGVQWWGRPLTSGWDIAGAFAAVLLSAAGPLAYLLALLLTAVLLGAAAGWLSVIGDLFGRRLGSAGQTWRL